MTDYSTPFPNLAMFLHGVLNHRGAAIVTDNMLAGLDVAVSLVNNLAKNKTNSMLALMDKADQSLERQFGWIGVHRGDTFSQWEKQVYQAGRLYKSEMYKTIGVSVVEVIKLLDVGP